MFYLPKYIKTISLYWEQSSYNFAIFDTAFLMFVQDIDDNMGWWKIFTYIRLQLKASR